MLNGTETGWGYTQGTTYDIQGLIISNMMSANFGVGYSSHFVRLSSISEGIRFGSSVNKIMIYTFRGSGFDSDVKWKQYLADQYAAGTPVVVYYPLATPVEESMPPRCQ